jgi:hypothetical protein
VSNITHPLSLLSVSLGFKGLNSDICIVVYCRKFRSNNTEIVNRIFSSCLKLYDALRRPLIHSDIDRFYGSISWKISQPLSFRW